jgi:hypothetical protein
MHGLTMHRSPSLERKLRLGPAETTNVMTASPNHHPSYTTQY